MSKLDELKAKHAKELAAIEVEESIRAALPDVGAEWGIHVHSLYGLVASASLKQPWTYGTESLGLDVLLKAAEALPGLPMVRVKGTFTSYLAVAQLPFYETGRTKIDSEEPIAPWIVEAEGGPGTRSGNRCTVEWRTALPGIGLVEVNFELPYMQSLRFSAHRKEIPGGVTWDSENCHVDHGKLFTIFAVDGGTPVANLGDRTKWAAGSSEYPSKITQTWTCLDEPATATVADFARALIAAK